MTLALHLHCFLASLSFIHFGVILAWPATGIPAIRLHHDHIIIWIIITLGHKVEYIM